MPNNILLKPQPIDYGTLPQDVNDIKDRVRQTTSDFNNRVDELFPEIKIKQEKERIKQEEKNKKDTIPWYSKLGYAVMTSPSTPGDSPVVSPLASERWMVGDKEGAQSMQKTQDTIGSVAAGLSLLGPYGIADFAQTTGTYGLGTALAAEGLSWGTGAAGYYGGNWLGQKIDNKYETNITPWLSTIGALGGGAAGYSGVLRSSPAMIKRMLNEAKKMDWTPEGIVIPDKTPKWKWSSSKEASYDVKNSALKLPLFARKSQIGHELGHYIGDVGVIDPLMVKGAFTKGYEYSPGVEFERNAAENFADHFKTKLGYPYKGKDPNLTARQLALQNETVFDDVARTDDRLYYRPRFIKTYKNFK